MQINPNRKLLCASASLCVHQQVSAGLHRAAKVLARQCCGVCAEFLFIYFLSTYLPQSQGSRPNHHFIIILTKILCNQSPRLYLLTLQYIFIIKTVKKKKKDFPSCNSMGWVASRLMPLKAKFSISNTNTFLLLKS